MSVNKNQRNLCERARKWARMRWQKEAKKNPCLWIGVRKLYCANLHANQPIPLPKAVRRRTVLYWSSLSPPRSMCVCVCFCGYIHTSTSVLYRIPHSQCFRHSYHQKFLCGLLLYTLFSTFILLVFGSSFYICCVRFQSLNDFGFHISQLAHWDFFLIFFPGEALTGLCVHVFRIGMRISLSLVFSMLVCMWMSECI